MLCQFTFKNFKSYKSETQFDLQAVSIPEFSDSLLVSEQGNSLLPVSVIYGPNGGGKSNLLQALTCLITTVVKPIHDLEKNRTNNIIQQHVTCMPYKFDNESKSCATEFEVFFRKGKNEYRYNLALKDLEIVYESLYWRAIGGKKTGTLFEREGSEITLGPSINRTSTNRSVNPKMPYLSFLAINYDFSMIAEIQEWFESCIIRNYGNPRIDSLITVLDDSNERKRVLLALNDVDIDLSGYRFDENEGRLYTQRTIGGTAFELDLMEESEGTRKLFMVLPYLLLALNEGRLILIDELDAKLHPKLLKYIISLFKNPGINRKGAQLLFTSQDLTTMKNTVFRRDEIWFAAQNASHESEIYSLYDIRNEDNAHVNNTAAYDKQYIEGRYGADPYLKNMLTGSDWK